MTETRLPAFETPGGHLVRHQDRLWVKAERPSKDYVNHYLVPTQAVPELTLLYIDPETELELVAQAVTVSGEVSRQPDVASAPGDMIADPEGRLFIKALDVKKDGQRHLAYVDIASGEIHPRKERKVKAVFSFWVLIAD